MEIKNADIRELGLSVRSTNSLLRAGKHTVKDIVQCSFDDLMRIPNCGIKSATEIYKKAEECKQKMIADELNEAKASASSDPKRLGIIESEWFSPVSKKNRLYKILSILEYQCVVHDYTVANDVTLAGTNVSNRTKNLLKNHGYVYMSDILFADESDIRVIPYAGTMVVEEVVNLINEYLQGNKPRIFAVICGDMGSFWTDDAIKVKVLELYRNAEFKAFSCDFICDKLSRSTGASESRIKTLVDSLVEDGVLGLNDADGYYRVYPGFGEYVADCDWLDPRIHSIIMMRLQGETLESIGNKIGVTRERVRQLSQKGVKKIILRHEADDHTKLFQEDQYRYFYTTYNILDTDGGVQIDPDAKRYFEIAEIRHGKKPVEDALDDSLVDDTVKDQISDYLTEGCVEIDGTMIKATRPNLEEAFLKKYGRDDMYYEDFVPKFNTFLADIGITDRKIYYTDEVAAYRFWRLSERRFVLWKEGKTFRYYDIDGTDFTELLDTLDLGQYENTGFSTEVLVRKHPALMKKYDIQDKCELHNLLRKIVPDGSYHDFHCGRMPSILFGNFNMPDAMLDLLREHTPIRETELIKTASEKYGYSANVIISNWSDVFIPYRHEGTLCMDFKDMSAENKAAFCKELGEDVYTIKELANAYQKMFPNADAEEINPYSLKGIGFSVTPTIAYRNYDSLCDCFTQIAASSSQEEMTALRARFNGNQVLARVLSEMRRINL